MVLFEKDSVCPCWSSQKALPRPNMPLFAVDQFVKVLETTPMPICVSPCSPRG